MREICINWSANPPYGWVFGVGWTIKTSRMRISVGPNPQGFCIAKHGFSNPQGKLVRNPHEFAYQNMYSFKLKNFQVNIRLPFAIS